MPESILQGLVGRPEFPPEFWESFLRVLAAEGGPPRDPRPRP